MNFLKQALSSYGSHSSRSWRQPLFLLRPITQSSPYSTTYKLSNPQPRKAKTTTQKPQEPPPPPPSSSSMSWHQRIKKQAEGSTDWPRPSEIPYQSKVANSVNLIGQVTTPVKFHSAPDGKSFAGAVISQENDEHLVIPMLFEGDLASVVDAHVKKNDCVYVEGKLSEDSLPFDLDDCRGNFHLVVENINFVVGYEKKPSRKKMVTNESGGGRTYPEKVNVQEYDDQLRPSKTPESEISEPEFSQDNLNSAKAVKKDDLGNDPWKDLVKNPGQWRDYREQKSNRTVVPKHPDFKHGRISLWLDSAPKWVLPEIEKMFGKVNSNEVKASKASKGEDSWKNLVEYPSKWWDNRLNKKNPKGPDFTHKETKEALWLNSAPNWVLPKLPEPKEKVANWGS
ncbi:OLC1v1034628C1 [Oldenlandia corymbosa var. corymbosa]|uniref:OLC1v1034628C1 n=1 Tax=Oldenlandia corymbosa var. corymbosa TaxID=529605 RepID=A0AAV1CU70_OLDCO|nr:OLC1v1034628C1 [Oldenlandia corymbosa var. corymbosa]